MSEKEAQQGWEQEQEGGKPRKVLITERDLFVLRWIGEQYAARVDQIQRLLGMRSQSVQQRCFLSESATRVWRRRMQRLGVLSEIAIFKGLPYHFLTGPGLKLTGLDFKPMEPATATLQHLYWCNQIRLLLAEQRPDDTWRAERFLRRDVQGHEGKKPEIPDAHLITIQGIIAIEVELADKEQKRLEIRLRKRATAYYSTWIFCSKESRPGVERAWQRLEQSHQRRIGIYDLPL